MGAIVCQIMRNLRSIILFVKIVSDDDFIKFISIGEIINEFVDIFDYYFVYIMELYYD